MANKKEESEISIEIVKRVITEYLTKTLGFGIIRSMTRRSRAGAASATRR